MSMNSIGEVFETSKNFKEKRLAHKIVDMLVDNHVIVIDEDYKVEKEIYNIIIKEKKKYE